MNDFPLPYEFTGDCVLNILKSITKLKLGWIRSVLKKQKFGVKNSKSTSIHQHWQVCKLNLNKSSETSYSPSYI